MEKPYFNKYIYTELSVVQSDYFLLFNFWNFKMKPNIQQYLHLLTRIIQIYS